MMKATKSVVINGHLSLPPISDADEHANDDDDG